MGTSRWVLVATTILSSTLAFGWEYPLAPYQSGSYAGRTFFCCSQSHLGEDVAAAEGTAIRAIGPGQIVYYGPAGGYGDLVVAIEHDLGSPQSFTNAYGHSVSTRYLLSIYGHLRPSQTYGGPPVAEIFQSVLAGTVIGYVNDDANNGDGAEHVHVAIRLSNAATARARDAGFWLRGYNTNKGTVCGASCAADFASASAVISKLSSASACTVSVGQGTSGAELAAFQNAHNSAGGRPTLGCPTAAVRFDGFTSFAGTVAHFQDFERGAIEFHTNNALAGQAFAIFPQTMYQKWKSLGLDVNHPLGYPTGQPSPQRTSCQGTAYRYQQFEGGHLEYHLSGNSAGKAFEIHGWIRNKWDSMGFAGCPLGLPTADERDTLPSFVSGIGGRVSDLEGGHIHYQWGAPDAYVTFGNLDKKYVELGGTASCLGFPIEDANVGSSGFPEASFEGGTLTSGDGVNYVADCSSVPPPPTVVTGDAIDIGPFGATLTGTVGTNGAPTTAYFQLGTSPSYGTTYPTAVTPDGSGTAQVWAAAYDLTCGTTYYYRAVATNAGGSQPGMGRFFSTSPCGQATVRLTWPTGGQTLQAGSTYSIQWESSGFVPPTDTEIYLLQDGWYTPLSIEGSSTTTFDWTVPTDLRGSAKIELYSWHYNTLVAYDANTAPFTVVDPAPGPIVGVSPSHQSFGDVVIGSSTTRSVTVTNTGGGTLSGSASTTPPFSVVGGSPYSLGPGSSTTVTLQFNPFQAASVSGTLFLTGGSGAAVALTGNGKNPGPITLEYVALGDSYSSGEGAFQYIYPTDTQENQCHRSAFAYSRMDFFGTLFDVAAVDRDQFWACSGATTHGVLYEGEYEEPGGKLAQIELASLNTDTDIVTLSIGGNDARFADVVRKCVTSSNCRNSKLFNGSLLTLEQYLPDLIDNVVQQRLINTFSVLRDGAPTSRIVALGYPRIFPQAQVDQQCSELQNIVLPFLELEPDEQDFLNEMADELNAAISSAAATVGGVDFVSVTDEFAGHEVCGPNGAWIWGPHFKLNELSADEKSFHPTDDGQRMGYRAAMKKYVDSFDGVLPPNDPPSPDLQLAPISIPMPTVDEIDVQPLDGLACTLGKGVFTQGQAIQISGSGFLPGASVDVRVDSGIDVYSIETTFADSLGAIDALVTIPAEVLPTPLASIDAEGLGNNGEPLLLTTTVAILPSFSDDTDVDGVPDVCDNCPNTVGASQSDIDGDGVGDACDLCPNDPENDADGDGLCADVDASPNDATNAVVIGSFTVSPQFTDAPGTAVLSWSTTGATSLSIAGVAAGLAPFGSAHVDFSATTTYTLSANGDGGTSADAFATVKILPVDLVLSYDTVDEPMTYEALNSITAGPSFDVLTGADVTARAGNVIVLGNGFTITPGASFSAVLDPALAP